MEKIDARTLKPEVQEQLRKQAIQLRQKGHSILQIAAILDVNPRTVYRWCQLHKRGGAKSIRLRKRGRPLGACRKLTAEHEKKVQRLIRDKQPDQLKLAFALWSRIAVQQLIKQLWAMRMPIRTVGEYLKRWGFTPQKPARRAWEQNPEEVQQWLETDYPTIRQRAKLEQAQIFWGDEMGLRSDHATGRSYGLRGQTPLIPGPGKRFGCNMVSAITNRGRLQFMVFKERFTTAVFLEFLQRLVRQNPGKVFLIIDRHPVHRARKVKTWVEENAHKIEIFFMPGYSPELNPDELLNQDVKSNAVGRKRAAEQKQLVKNVRSFLRSHQRRP